MSKILHLIEKNRAVEFKNKSLDEIELDMGDIDEDDDGTKEKGLG